MNVSPRGHASITKLRTASTGVTVSRLKSGRFSLSAHYGDRRVIVEMDADELVRFTKELQELVMDPDR